MTDQEVFEFKAPWQIYGLSWSRRKDQPFRLAIGSFIEEYCNKVMVVQLDPTGQRLEQKFIFSHPYPATNIEWFPSDNNSNPDLLATTGDYLRIWEVKDNEAAKMKCMLTANKNSEFCAPLTSFDWSTQDTNIIGTSSIDTTCTIWDLNKEQIRTQLIAHDKEVYDIIFSPHEASTFTSVGADGSVRMFDLRNLEHSTVIYENENLAPLLRVSYNNMDPNYLACLAIESNKVTVVDIRYPSMPAATLTAHHSTISALTWAPHSSCHICTAGDDWQALIWDLQTLPEPVHEPILAYSAEGEVNNLRWSSLQTDWVSICYQNRLQTLRI